MTNPDSQHIRPLMIFSIILIAVESIIILLAETLFLKMGFFTVGLSAALIEMFYENAGVKQGSWEFHDSTQKIGHMSIEFVPIASCGTVLTSTFVIWQGSNLPFPLGGSQIFSLYNNSLPLILGVGTICSFIVFSWFIFVKHKQVETLWLVIPLFLTGISLIESSLLHRVIVTMVLVIYLSSFFEYVLIQKTSSYTYTHGYRPAVTSLAYAFFTMGCFFILIGDRGIRMEQLWMLNPYLIIALILGLVVIISSILILQIRSRSRTDLER